MEKREIKIEKIRIVHKTDENPDYSFMGEYVDIPEAGVIVRRLGIFWEDMPEDQEVPQRGREYRFFKPYAGGEKVGTEDYKKYGMQDFKRMESLNRGHWFFMGIYVEAEVSYPIELGSRRLEWLKSGGLWGIESDSDESYIDEIDKEQLDDLKEHLEVFGVDVSNFEIIKKEKAYK